MELGAQDYDPWATSSGVSFNVPPKEQPQRTMATCVHGHTAGSDRYLHRPIEQRERLARLGSPELTRHAEPTRGVPRRRGPKARPIAVNIFEDIALHASAYDVGSGRAMGAKYHRGGQRGHIGGYADLGNDNHYGLVGERTTKQNITAGYNHADNDGTSSRGAQIKVLMERLDRCAAAVVYVGSFTEARLTQMIGQASQDLQVHHREAWLLTNTQKPSGGIPGSTTAVDSGRGDSAKLRWCTVRMDDGLVVAVYWVEPGVPRFTAWVQPTIAGGSGTKAGEDDEAALAELAPLEGSGGGGDGSGEEKSEGSDWGESESDAGGSQESIVDVQNA